MANEEFLARASGHVNQDGTVVITLNVRGEEVVDHVARHKDDNRVFYLGLVILAYTVSNDLELRIDLFERLSHRS